MRPSIRFLNVVRSGVNDREQERMNLQFTFMPGQDSCTPRITPNVRSSSTDNSRNPLWSVSTVHSLKKLVIY